MFDRNKTIVLVVIMLLGLSACDHKSTAIQPEHISIEVLNQELNAQLINGLAQTNAASQLQIENSQDGLILSGDPALIAKAIHIAKQLDKPQNYYLEVRNTPINTISTTTETMRIMLHPEQPIMLGHTTLTDGPWKELITEQHRTLQLHLDASLVLSIDIKNRDKQAASFYSGRHPMQVNKWLIAFNSSELNRGKKIITSRPQKQLWLRLVKASSQSDVNLR
jgi:hypothetical protein